jgi:GcrA cell cycle regulator
MPTVEKPAAPAAVIETTIPAPLRVKLLDLKECMCRWPIGDPKSADFHFCGRQKATGSSFCEHHSRIAFRPTERSQG